MTSHPHSSGPGRSGMTIEFRGAFKNSEAWAQVAEALRRRADAQHLLDGWAITIAYDESRTEVECDRQEKHLIFRLPYDFDVSEPDGTALQLLLDAEREIGG